MCDGVLRAADDRVGRYADGAKLANRVLGGFGLQFVGRTQMWHKRQMDVHDVVVAHVVFKLTDCFKKRQGLDVANRASDLDNAHVRGTLQGYLLDSIFDLVGDVRNDLDGCAQIRAATLLFDDRAVNLPRCYVVELGEILIDEALVVSEVEVGFGTVFRHEHLTMLVRIHGAGISINVGIQFLDADRNTAALQQTPERCGCDTLPKRRDHAAREKDKTGHKFTCLCSSGPLGPLPQKRQDSCTSRFAARSTGPSGVPAAACHRPL